MIIMDVIVYFVVAEAEVVEIKVESELKITSSPWNESLSDPSSDMFVEMKDDLEEKMDKAFCNKTDTTAEVFYNVKNRSSFITTSKSSSKNLSNENKHTLCFQRIGILIHVLS